MKNSVNVLCSLVCVEFLLYTVCLCAPEWLVQPEGTTQGLFAICYSYEGLSSCTTFPAWMGSYSLTWVFLAASSILSLATLVTIRPALTKGKRAIEALLLNIFSVAFCMSALIAFMVSMEKQLTEVVKFLGWAFYICCTTLFYGSLVSVALGLVQGSSSIRPASSQNCPGMPVISP
ncbi:uncharacterized protein LOC143526996 [Brachyhypopomus gauderio]|uniref:uncharacterized protein LOC143526996 n=1 Tax=Brachyhypopomus gauderio TaxID=698409 RepID=UPI00404149DE